MFLKPDRYPKNFKGFTIKTPDDTLRIHFSGPSHQPVFTKRNGRDTIQLNYEIKSVVFKNSSGDSLNGWFLKPPDQPANITLLHLHGNGGSLFSQYKLISPLVKNGIQVFMFDYSGFGFSQGKATRKNALADALSALDYIKTLEEVKGTRLVVYGQSFGGHLAAVVAEKREGEIDGLVTEGAFSSPKDIAADKFSFIGRWLVKEIYAADKSIKHFRKPVLIIHSTDDTVIPFYMGQKLFDLANPPKEFYEINKCHICGPAYYSGEISAKIKKMLK